MDSKAKYNKLQEVIDSMTEDERKSLETNIEEYNKRLNQKILEEANKIAKNPNFKKANFIKINK